MPRTSLLVSIIVATLLSGCGGSTTGDAIVQPPPTPTDTVSPPYPPASRAVQVAAGFTSYCALVASGDAYCWGENRAGELGDGTRAARATPVRAQSSVPFTTIVGTHGTTRFCALDAAGRAYCWGYNLNGELGDGSDTDRSIPTAVVGGLTFTALSSSYHTCGITSSGRAYCWGLSLAGSLGQDPEGASQFSPVPVAGTQVFTTIATGQAFSCALTPAGDTYCWGSITTTAGGARSLTPVRVADAPRFTALQGAHDYACGLTPDGLLYCWGGVNGTGRPWITTPTRVQGVPPFTKMALGYYASCGLTADGTAWCWLPGSINPPRAVSATVRFVAMAGGRDQACGATARGDVYCWGIPQYQDAITRVVLPGQ